MGRPVFSARSRLGVTCVLLAGTVLLGRVPAGAQGSSLSPPNTPEAYALLALEKMHVSGPISLLTGSLGVNDNDGDLEVDRSVPLQLNTQDGVIASKKASLLRPSVMCTSAAFFANTIPGNSAN